MMSGALLHRITKPAARRGGLQVVEDLEEDAKAMRRCDEKRKSVDEALTMRLTSAIRGGQAVEDCRVEMPTSRKRRVEQCGKWPQQACTTMFFSVPETFTRELVCMVGVVAKDQR